jgi:hypothetical protein
MAVQYVADGPLLMRLGDNKRRRGHAPFEQLKCVNADSELWSALQYMDRNGVN